jgi:hypothetical protein
MRLTSTLRFAALLLLLPVLASAQDAPRHPFPRDYTPHPCAAKGLCEQGFTHSEMARLGNRMFGLYVDLEWVKLHEKELFEESFEPMCHRLETCYAVPGNTTEFCNDYMVGEMRAVCDRFKSESDHTKCAEYVEMYMLGIDTGSLPVWKEAQACTNSQFPDWKSDVPPVVWVEPARIPAGFSSRLKIFAQDVKTKVPVQARITVGDQVLFSKINPNGRVDTYYPFTWPIKLVRVRRADGHEDLVPPMVTVKAERYPAVTFPMPYDVPTLKTSITPELSKLKKGTNRITVSAVDAATGKPVEMRVMAGTTVLGESNKPIELVLTSGRTPEIWATSLFNVYSDVVIAAAQK